MVRIRIAKPADAEAVAGLWHQYDLYEHGLDKRVTIESKRSYLGRFKNILKDKSSIIAIAESDSMAVGVIEYVAYKRGMLTIGTLGNLFVLEEYRGNGIGSQLVGHVVEKLKEKGCSTIRSGVRVRNKKAQRFWRGKGFKIDLTSITDYSMAKDL